MVFLVGVYDDDEDGDSEEGCVVFLIILMSPYLNLFFRLGYAFNRISLLLVKKGERDFH